MDQPRSPLLALPEELMSAIASHLTNQYDILRLALGCKYLNRIATEYLYQEVRIIQQNSPRISKWYRQQIEALALRLRDNPSIARYVKRLVVRWQWSEQEKFDFITPSAIVEMFIHILPNLEHLDYFPHADSRLDICRSPLVEGSSCPRLKPLQRVKEILLGSRYGFPYTLKPECYMPHFSLPNLKKILLFGIALRDSSFGFGNPGIEKFNAHMERILDFRATNALSVEHVEIRKCNLDWAVICQIIGRCRALHTYIHLVGGFRNTYLPYELKALELHQSSLKNLHLDYIGNLSGFVDDPSHGLNFSPLEYLENLKITWCELIGTPNIAERSWVNGEEYKAVTRRLPSRLTQFALVVPLGNEVDKDEMLLVYFVLERMMQERSIDWRHLAYIDVFVDDVYATQGLHMRGLFQASKQSDVELRVYHPNGKQSEQGWGVIGNDHWEPMLRSENLRCSYNEVIPL